MKRIQAHFPKLVLVVALVLLVTPILARGPHGPGHGRGPGPCGGPDGSCHERLFDRLDLTDDQREEIEALIADHRDATKDRADQMRARRMEMMELIQADGVDEAAIRDAAAASAQAEADLAIERAKLRQQIHQVLTPEQREQADALRQQHREFRQEGRRGSGRGGPHGHRGWHGSPDAGGPKDIDD